MAITSFAEEPEWQLLLAASRADRSPEEISSLLQLPIPWNKLLGLAENHGVSPLLYRALIPFPKSIPDDVSVRLASRHQTNIHKAMMLSRELICILEILAEKGIEVMPYKGPTLAELVYGDIALRQTGDIDLIVRAEDVGPTREALRSLNYSPHVVLPAKQEKAYLQSSYEYGFDAPAGRNLLEIQWALQPRFYAVDLNVSDLFQRAITASVSGHAARTLSFEDLFIVLSLHAAKHVWGKLIWLCDLTRIMSMENLDWTQIGASAKRFRIRRILTLNLLLANRILGVSVPPAAEKVVLEAGAEDLVEKIQATVFSSTPFDTESSDYFRLMLQLRESVIDRLRFVWRLALTPGPAEWASIRLPDGLFPFYRVVRLSRLASKLARS